MRLDRPVGTGRGRRRRLRLRGEHGGGVVARASRLTGDERREQRVAAHVVGRDLEDAAAHRDRLLRAALIAIHGRDRTIELDGFGVPAVLAQRTGERDAQPDVVGLLLQPLLELAKRLAHGATMLRTGSARPAP